MKFYSIILFFIVSFFTISCKDDLTDIGAGLNPSSIEIALGADTFHIVSENVFVDYMYSKPDSFLLGSFYDTKYGSIRTDIFAQVKSPDNFKYPDGSVGDSISVVLRYRSWFGDSYSPMEISVYEMDKDSTFSYTGLYKSNLNPATFTSKTKLLGSKIITAQNAGSTTSSSVISIKLSDSFKNSFKNGEPYYSQDSIFTKFFKGMYITANYGASTMLNISQIDLIYYYHYSYLKPGELVPTIVNGTKAFPANSEVRQVNRILHPDTAAVKLALQQKDTLNYISSPANIQTRLILPLKRINQRMKAQIINKTNLINSATLRVEEASDEDLTTLIPQRKIQYLLLIKESSMDRFFRKNELPSDTCAILGQYTSGSLITSNYYSFDLAGMLSNEMKMKAETIGDGTLKLRLVPVRVSGSTTSSGSQQITAVRQEFLMSATSVRSHKNSVSPMRLKVIYSGF